MINIAIVDDNELDSLRLKNNIIEYCKNNNIVFNIVEYSRAINFLEEYSNNFDVVFFDIDMPLIDGMEAAYKLRQISQSILIVFETNYSSLAIRGYGVDALDFIIKPVKAIDVDNIMNKIIHKLAQEKNDSKIIIKVKSGFQTLRLCEIKYIEVATHDIYYYCTNGEFTSRGVLKEVEKQLDSAKFVKCSNSFLINLDFVESIIKDEVMIDGRMIKMSRNRKKEFIDAYLKNFN